MSAGRPGRPSGNVTPQSSASSTVSDPRYEDVRRSLSSNIAQAAVADEAVDEESGMLTAAQLETDTDAKFERFSRVRQPPTHINTHTHTQTWAVRARHSDR